MKTKPYLFLFFLIVILVFILGVRYGQKVEKNNKAVDYLISITPLPTPPPNTPSPSGIKKDASASPTLFNLKK
ncbi:MAG: hypothetical protein AAB441_04120 [Patescibacteria group bacterium]